MELERNDIWVGLFVIIGVVVIVGTLVVIAQGRFGDTIPLVARFDAIAGIQEGTPVMLRGYRVGEVKRIDFTSHPEVRFDVHFVIAKDVGLHQGTRAVITSTNMIGENYLLLDVTAANGTELAAGDVIPGESAQQLNDIVDRVDGVLLGAQRTVERLSEALRSADVEEGAGVAVQVDRIPLREMTETTVQLRLLIETLTRAVGEMQPSITQTASVAQGTMQTAQWTTAEAGSLLAENRDQLASLIANLDATTKNVNDLVVEIHGITRENREEIAGTMRELEKTSANLARLTGDLADHPWKLLFR